MKTKLESKTGSNPPACSLLVAVEGDGSNSRIQIKVAHQSFALEYQSDEPGAMEWFAGQVRSALAKAGTNVAENTLANDIARCDGVWVEDGDDSCWRECCETCLRRTAPRPEIVSMMSPPAIIAFECEYLIEPNSQDQERQQPSPVSTCSTIFNQ